MNTTLTRKEAFNTVDFAMEQFINERDFEDLIPTITYAVNNDLQIRDYFLGMPADYKMQACVDFVNYLTRMTNADECYAYDTISAMYHIERGNVELAKTLLSDAETSNPNYNLTKLAKRIISAGWDGQMLEKMREDLHLTVVNEIKNSDYVIVEVK